MGGWQGLDWRLEVATVARVEVAVVAVERVGVEVVGRGGAEEVAWVRLSSQRLYTQPPGHTSPGSG